MLNIILSLDIGVVIGMILVCIGLFLTKRG